MTLTAQLFALERLDSDIEARQGALRDAGRRIAGSPQLQTAEARLEALRTQAAAAMADQRRLESEIAELEERIKRDHSRLYSGQVVDSREIGSLERELVHYRNHKNELEDRCLTVMDRGERLQAEIDGLAARTGDLRDRWEADRTSLTGDIQRITDELTTLRARRAEAAAGIDPPSLTTYTRLRQSLGHAVAEVTGGVCALCRVTIPAKDIQHARSGTVIVHCPNCTRILYAGQPTGARAP